MLTHMDVKNNKMLFDSRNWFKEIGLLL